LKPKKTRWNLFKVIGKKIMNQSGYTFQKLAETGYGKGGERNIHRQE